MVSSEEPYTPFDLLDDGIVITILCFAEPESLGCTSLVCKRFAELCIEPYIWEPLLDAALLSSGEGFLALPSEGTSWRERYKQWHTLSSLAWSGCPLAAGSAQPTARYGHRAAAVSDSVTYVHGGIDAHGGLGDLWILKSDEAAKAGMASWELVASTSEHIPIARMSATLSPVYMNNSAHPALILFGGHGGGSMLNDVWLFDTRTAAWTMLLPHTDTAQANSSVCPDGRWAHSAITQSSSSEMVIFGGAAAGIRCFNDVLSFSVCTHRWTRHECAGETPIPRSGHSACRVAESMYIFGGNTTVEGYIFGGPVTTVGSLNDLWEYALDTRAWTQVVSTGGSVPSPRFNHSLIPLGSRLVVFGGRDVHVINSFDPALYCFDLQRRRWSELFVGGEKPRARAGHAVTSCEGGVLVFGGYGSSEDNLNDALLLHVWE